MRHQSIIRHLLKGLAIGAILLFAGPAVAEPLPRCEPCSSVVATLRVDNPDFVDNPIFVDNPDLIDNPVERRLPSVGEQ